MLTCMDSADVEEMVKEVERSPSKITWAAVRHGHDTAEVTHIGLSQYFTREASVQVLTGALRGPRGVDLTVAHD